MFCPTHLGQMPGGTVRFVMNWKIVASLIVGSSLLAACGTTGSQAPVNQGDTRTQQVDAPGGGAEQGATTTPPATKPADPPQDAKKNVVVHE
jgi:hypothetical protein